jgi:hypothetical protein
LGVAGADLGLAWTWMWDGGPWIWRVVLWVWVWVWLLCVRGMYGCGMLVMASCVLVCGGIACGVSLHGNDIGAEGCTALASGLHHVPSLTALQYVEWMGWCAECWLVCGAMDGCGWG